jgi:hypothetical protein
VTLPSQTQCRRVVIVTPGGRRDEYYALNARCPLTVATPMTAMASRPSPSAVKPRRRLETQGARETASEDREVGLRAEQRVRAVFA